MEKLEEEILFDILSRLPAKSLTQCKYVNKRWLSIISDPRFAREQLKRSLQDTPNSSYRLLLATSPIKSVDYEALVEANEEDHSAIKDLNFPVRVPKEENLDIVGSCDGLVFLRMEYDDDDGDVCLILWNPTTRESRELPTPEILSLEGDFLYGLGYDSSIDDYKFLVGHCSTCSTSTGTRSARVTVEIFTLKTNSWRRIEVEDLKYNIYSRGTYCHGSLHWLYTDTDADPKYKIVSFDISEETFHDTIIPLSCLDQSVDDLDGLGITQEWLFIYGGVSWGPLFEVWMMKEYGVGSSWTKVFSFSSENVPINKYSTTPLAFTRDSKIVFDYCGWELCLYDPEVSTYRSFDLHSDWEYFATATTYVESLVSPNGPIRKDQTSS